MDKESLLDKFKAIDELVDMGYNYLDHPIGVDMRTAYQAITSLETDLKEYFLENNYFEVMKSESDTILYKVILESPESRDLFKMYIRGKYMISNLFTSKNSLMCFRGFISELDGVPGYMDFAPFDILKGFLNYIETYDTLNPETNYIKIVDANDKTESTTSVVRSFLKQFAVILYLDHNNFETFKTVIKLKDIYY